MSRIFLSHSSKDTREAIALKAWLTEQRPELGDEIFIDVDAQTGLRLGEQWKTQLFTGKSRCEHFICLLSQNWVNSTECNVEYRTAEGLGKRILVARLEDLGDNDMTSAWQRCDLFAGGEQSDIEVRGGLPVRFNTAALTQIMEAVDGSGTGPRQFVWPPRTDPGRAPYRGWEPFEDIDAGIFFGRDALIAQGVDVLRSMRFRLLANMSGLKSLFVVLGPSGSGKSSFLRAGLIPRLRRQDRQFAVLGIMRPQGNTLRTWDVNTGKPVGRPMKGHTGTVTGVAISSNGHRIMSSSADKTLRMWDAKTGKPIGQPIAGHTEAVNSVAFSQDGHRVVSSSDDGKLRLWPAHPGRNG